MKKNFLIAGLFSVFAFISCKEDAASKVNDANAEVAAASAAKVVDYPVMTFDDSQFDFGNIEKGKKVEHEFTFTNTGKAPLVIVDAKSTCGCTVPKYSEEPVQPGEKGSLLVTYNGSGTNAVTKTVTIKANTEKGKETVRIKAFVEPAAK